MGAVSIRRRWRFVLVPVSVFLWAACGASSKTGGSASGADGGSQGGNQEAGAVSRVVAGVPANPPGVAPGTDTSCETNGCGCTNALGEKYCGICAATRNCIYCFSNDVCPSDPCTATSCPAQEPACPSDYPVECSESATCCPSDASSCCGGGYCGTSAEACASAASGGTGGTGRMGGTGGTGSGTGTGGSQGSSGGPPTSLTCAAPDVVCCIQAQSGMETPDCIGGEVLDCSCSCLPAADCTNTQQDGIGTIVTSCTGQCCTLSGDSCSCAQELRNCTCADLSKFGTPVASCPAGGAVTPPATDGGTPGADAAGCVASGQTAGVSGPASCGNCCSGKCYFSDANCNATEQVCDVVICVDSCDDGTGSSCTDNSQCCGSAPLPCLNGGCAAGA